MAQNIELNIFEKAHGKANVRRYNIGDNSWTALLCQDEDGNEIFISPPKSNIIMSNDGELLVDFNLPTTVIAEQISVHKSDLVVCISSKTWDSSEEDEILIYTLEAKHEIEEIDIEIEDTWIDKYDCCISELSSITFSDIRQISVKFINKFSEEKKDELFEELNHGMMIPTTNEQLHAYMYCFGLMHEAKLQKAFSEIPKGLFEHEIEIIDYACGQGIATICFANFLEDNDFFVESNNCATEIVKVTLIEPSAIALSRASLLCHKVCPKALIDTINSEFDELESSQVATTNIQRIHLLSNILDMTCYDINHLAKVIGKICRKGDIFICVDPWYHNKSLDGRQRKLMRLLNGKEIYHDAFNSGQLVPERTWTAYITVFKK